MRIATQFTLILLASNLAAHGQHFRQVTISTGPSPRWIAVADVNHDRNPDIVIPYQRDIPHPAENAVSILLGDGGGGFHRMPGSPLPLADCRGPHSVAAGDLTGDGTRWIVVACAESRTMLIYHRGAAGKFTSATRSIAGGWGSVAIARLTADPRSAILTANADAGSITIYFPDK